MALDNSYGTWKAYSNNYWPADYLVDQAGRVRDVHFGEGNYAQTEQDIRLQRASCDAMLTPTSPSVAFKIGEKSDDPLAMASAASRALR